MVVAYINEKVKSVLRSGCTINVVGTKLTVDSLSRLWRGEVKARSEKLDSKGGVCSSRKSE